MSSPAPGSVVPSRHPGDLLTTPLPLASVAVVVVNDRILKSHFPSAVTGKLSDFAGLIFFPLLVVAFIELCRYVAHIPTWQLDRRALAAVVCGVGALFTLIKVVHPIGDVYQHALGTAQWPLRVLWAEIRGANIPSRRPVSLTRDPSDLTALSTLLVAWRLGCRRVIWLITTRAWKLYSSMHAR